MLVLFLAALNRHRYDSVPLCELLAKLLREECLQFLDTTPVGEGMERSWPSVEAVIHEYVLFPSLELIEILSLWSRRDEVSESSCVSFFSHDGQPLFVIAALRDEVGFGEDADGAIQSSKSADEAKC